MTHFNSKIKVTVVTGFLGAGKTTFINQVLQLHPRRKFALVENEFGEVPVDTSIIKGVETSQMFELKQGCICCSIAGEYELVLSELSEKYPDTEHLIVETTGVAEIAPVLSPFYRNSNLKKRFEIYPSVCVVDTTYQHRDETKKIAEIQIIQSDILYLSKTDKASPVQLTELQNELKRLNPTGAILSGAELFSLDNQSVAPKKITDLELTRVATKSGISSRTLYFPEIENKEKFIADMQYTLAVCKPDILRAKGIFSLKSEPYKFILQGVGADFEFYESDILRDKSPNFLVLTGFLQNIDILGIFNTCED